jgi:hypothetical protein
VNIWHYRAHGFVHREVRRSQKQDDTAAHIEVVSDSYAAPPAAKNMHESLY